MKNEISTSKKNILLVLHKGPDADAVASAYAIVELLKQQDPEKKFYAVSEKGFKIPFPKQLSIPELQCQITNKEIPEDCCAIIIDHSTQFRSLLKDWNNPRVTEMIVVDHHTYYQEARQNATLILDDTAISTTQVIYDYLAKRDFKGMTPDIATAIYIGMFSDSVQGMKPLKVEHFRIVTDLADKHGAKIEENNIYAKGFFFSQEKAIAEMIGHGANKSKVCDVVTVAVNNKRYQNMGCSYYINIHNVIQRLLNCRSIHHVLLRIEYKPNSGSVSMYTNDERIMKSKFSGRTYRPDLHTWLNLSEKGSKELVNQLRERLTIGEMQNKPENYIEGNDLEPEKSEQPFEYNESAPGEIKI